VPREGGAPMPPTNSISVATDGARPPRRDDQRRSRPPRAPRPPREAQPKLPTGAAPISVPTSGIPPKKLGMPIPKAAPAQSESAPAPSESAPQS
jgi:hypothetical protein